MLRKILFFLCAMASIGSFIGPSSSNDEHEQNSMINVLDTMQLQRLTSKSNEKLTSLTAKSYQEESVMKEVMTNPSTDKDGSLPPLFAPSIPTPSFSNITASPYQSSYDFPPSYSFDLSTEDNYRYSSSETSFMNGTSFVFRGQFPLIRYQLDYNYHAIYTPSRQLVQDAIVESFLDQTTVVDANGNTCHRPQHPWIVFTAGVMGVGKTHTIRFLASTGRFPLKSFVVVDPDNIRQQLPEFDWYVTNDPYHAGERTKKEAGYIAEILTMAALEQGKNVLVDGSLKDASWYSNYFALLRNEYQNLRIAILHITAPVNEIFQRAESRSRLTGRIVPRATIEEAMEMVPKSVNVLSPLSDFYCQLHNADTIQLATSVVTWESFQQTWIQSCGHSRQKEYLPPT